MKKIMAKKKWAIPALVVAFAMGYFSSVYAGQWYKTAVNGSTRMIMENL